MSRRRFWCTQPRHQTFIQEWSGHSQCSKPAKLYPFQSQDGVFENRWENTSSNGRISHFAFDITATDGDRENYNKEFLELADQLSKFSSEKFGDKQFIWWGNSGIDYIEGTGASDLITLRILQILIPVCER